MTMVLDKVVGRAVSRETEGKLRAFSQLITQWTARINLISKATEDDVWHRHIVDSAQLFPHIPAEAARVVDLGSGAGLPGLVIAMLAAELRPGLSVTLIESDLRKATFLRTAARELGLNVFVLSRRIEQTDPLGADVITSRALAPLVRLLPLAARHLAPGGSCLFLKGASWRDELSQLTQPVFCQDYPSATGDGAILHITIKDDLAP